MSPKIVSEMTYNVSTIPYQHFGTKTTHSAIVSYHQLTQRQLKCLLYHHTKTTHVVVLKVSRTTLSVQWRDEFDSGWSKVRTHGKPETRHMAQRTPPVFPPPRSGTSAPQTSNKITTTTLAETAECTGDRHISTPSIHEKWDTSKTAVGLWTSRLKVRNYWTRTPTGNVALWISLHSFEASQFAPCPPAHKR